MKTFFVAHLEFSDRLTVGSEVALNCLDGAKLRALVEGIDGKAVTLSTEQDVPQTLLDMLHGRVVPAVHPEGPTVELQPLQSGLPVPPDAGSWPGP